LSKLSYSRAEDCPTVKGIHKFNFVCVVNENLCKYRYCKATCIYFILLLADKYRYRYLVPVSYEIIHLLILFFVPITLFTPKSRYRYECKNWRSVFC
jgi:hypothetical protein